MPKRRILGVKLTTAIRERISEVAAAEIAKNAREQDALDAAAESERKAADAAVQVREHTKREKRRAAIAEAECAIASSIPDWRGINRSDLEQSSAVHRVALEWTVRNDPGATAPSAPMVAARVAELIAREWLTARLGTSIRDVSLEKSHRDEDGPAFARYDLLEEPGGRRYDVKNTISPILARHVLGRTTPARGVTLVGVSRTWHPRDTRYDLLGALDGTDLAHWDEIVGALDGVRVLAPPSTTATGARIRPSWMFGSPRHHAFAPRNSTACFDPVERLDGLAAWGEVSPHLSLLHPSARSRLPAAESDTGRLMLRFARRLQELAVGRLELRHLYVLTLEDFRARYLDDDYDASVYRRAFVPFLTSGSADCWQTPGGTWDPCRYYRALVTGLSRLAAHRAFLPPVIRTIHVTPANTVIANLRSRTDRGGPPPLTLLAHCGTRGCESRMEPDGRPLLIYGEPGVKVDLAGGFLICPACGGTAR